MRDGKYGPYVNHGKVNATLPKDVVPEQITLQQALELIAAKAGKPAGGKKKTTAKKKAAAKPKTGAKAKPKRAAKEASEPETA